jgi:hypothetical protein
MSVFLLVLAAIFDFNLIREIIFGVSFLFLQVAQPNWPPGGGDPLSKVPQQLRFVAVGSSFLQYDSFWWLKTSGC